MEDEKIEIVKVENGFVVLWKFDDETKKYEVQSWNDVLQVLKILKWLKEHEK
jgi:hypothetical protein